jgi:hypothetical protein
MHRNLQKGIFPRIFSPCYASIFSVSMISASTISAAMFPASMLSGWMHFISILSASLPVSQLVSTPQAFSNPHLHGSRTRAFWCFRCTSMFFVALLAALSAHSGRLLEPSSLRGEQRAHSLLGICQSRFIVCAVQHIPFRRLSFARPLRFVDSS